jgi:hypothetical protein
VRDSISIEFPVSDTALIEEFLEASLNWARQIRHTRLFEKTASPTLSERDEFILEQGDESLHFKKWIGDGQEAAGLRYARGDDAQGVIWTTECVMTLAPETSSVILRGSCLAQRPDATTHQPKKPQLVRLLLDAGLGGHDAEMQVRLTPHDLLTDDTDLHEDIRYGRAAHALPIILVSRGPQPHEARTLGDFARQLSGMAHVVTYPSVDFTARVAAMPGPLTPRGGAIALALPGKGIVRRYFIGPSLPDWKAVSEAAENDVIRFLSAFSPRHGMDWTELQDRHARAMRRTLGDESFNAYVADFDAELGAKDARIAELGEELAALRNQAQTAEYDQEDVSARLHQAEADFGALYSGELTDRLAKLLKIASSLRDLSARDAAALAAVQDVFGSSGKARALVKAIKRAAKSGSNPAAALVAVLRPSGYEIGRTKTHDVLTHPAGGAAFPNITAPKTPSDHRAGDNLGAQIINLLNLRDL